ncbi:MAG: ATP-binding protein [Paraprevotella sp.]|nr:ATP-binding protein [Paraprevotella sp.]
MEQIRQIPYGVADFESVVRRNLYYVDKTMFLPELESQPDTQIFIRPRRFGKSLFISMMKAYYDKANADRFDKLFGNLWIGQHPTPLRNKYQVMYFDYSRAGGRFERLEEDFDSYSCGRLDTFIERYRDDYPQSVVEKVLSADSARQKLNLINNTAQELGLPLFLIIDEYDNFTNIVLNEQGEEIYHAITHASGFYRDFFKLFKGMFERIFLTGVSPVTIDDLTSGFNIGWNLSTHPAFDKMLGFSTEDVIEMFKYYKSVDMLPDDCDIHAMIKEMKPWYDNYCFAKQCLKDANRVFNCDMVLYYLRNYVSYGCGPENMLDPNTKTDYSKLKKLIQLDRLDGERKGVLDDIVANGQITAELYESFSAMEMTKPEYFPSLLFYYGMLTIKGLYGSQPILAIPNNNVRMQYYNYMLENYGKASNVMGSKLKNGFTAMAYEGKWEETLHYMADCYKNMSSVRDSIEGERNIQGFFLAYFSLNDYYYTAPELELQHGYCDFFLLPNLTHYPSAHCYIIEMKYLPKKDYAEKAEQQWNEAVEQINVYATAPRVEALRQGTQLHKIVMQFAGWELMRMEEIG